MLETFVEKNVDYGDSFKDDGVVGVVIRIGDKLKRLKTISKDGHIIQVKDEGLRDTLMDLANYAAMGVMLLDEEEAMYSIDQSEFVQQGKDDNPESSCECGDCSCSGE